MKKGIALVLTLVMILGVFGGYTRVGAEATDEIVNTAAILNEGPASLKETSKGGEAPAEDDGTKQAVTVAYDYNELTVATTNLLTGRFFTDLWGGNTSDLDVRALLHGYSLTEYRIEDGTFGIDASVVNAFASQNRSGNREYVISIYEDLYYSDGTKITAKDYAFSILLNLAPQMQKIGAETSGMYYIKGAEAFRTGRTDVLTGVKLLGDYQFSITVDKAYIPFFYELGYLNINPYPISVIAPGCEVADDGDGVYIKNARSKFTPEVLKETVLDGKKGYQSHPSVVSGPYKLVSFDGTQAVFEINEYYKGNSAGNKPRIPRIIYKSSDNATVIEELGNAGVGLANKAVNAQTISGGIDLVTNAAYNMTSYPRNGYAFVSFCCEQAAVSDVAVRQAIALCFDKRAFTSDYTGDYGITVDGYYGIGQWMYQVANGTAVPESISEKDRASLTLDGLKKYDLDVAAAKELLESNGWSLEDGQDVRSKGTGKKKVTLELTLLCPAETGIKPLFEKYLGENLKKAGIKLTVVEKPYADLLQIYYRQAERDCDMIYLATNFETVFDPSETFNPDDAYQGISNRTGITDKRLYRLARSMSQTAPDDMAGYIKKWIAFQKRYTEVLPTIPVYSNVYYDFYTSALKDYEVTSYTTWTQAIVNAVMSDVAE